MMTSKFQPEPRPRVLKTNISKIMNYISDRITSLGYNVYISFSQKSNSRYLTVRLSKERKIVIRIADHPADKSDKWRFKFDVFTIERRHGSVDYIEFLDIFKQIIAGGNHG